MKFVVTGTTGQVGWELIRALQPLGEVVPVSIDDLDLTDADHYLGCSYHQTR